jgi:hypothetical protein
MSRYSSDDEGGNHLYRDFARIAVDGGSAHIGSTDNCNKIN